MRRLQSPPAGAGGRGREGSHRARTRNAREPARGRRARVRSGRERARSGRRRSWVRRLFRIGLVCGLLGFGVPLVVVLLLRWVPPPTTAFMVQSAQAHADSPAWSGTGYRWTAWDDIAPVAGLAVIAAEDQRFPDHRGFDIDAIRSALADALEGERLRGASTISQQTVKNLFLWPGRSALRKGLEAGLTLLVELCWSQAAHPGGLPERGRVRGRPLRHHRGQRALLRQAARPTWAPTRRRGSPPSSPTRPACAPTARRATSAPGSGGSAGRWTGSAASRLIESLDGP